MNRPRVFPFVGPAVLVISVLFATGCDSKSRGEDQQPGENDSNRVAEETTSVDPAPDHALPDPDDVTSPSRRDLRVYTSDLGGDGELIATLVTTEGAIECRLFGEHSPITVANFVGLARGEKAWVDPESDEVRKGTPLYDGVPFHRVIPGFMIQGGDPTGTGDGGPGYTIPDEQTASLSHETPGTLSMANRGPGTGGSQFFITQAPAPHLDGRHTIFGRCQNLDVVEAIAERPTGSKDTPENPARIETVEFRRGAWDGPEIEESGASAAPGADVGPEPDAARPDLGETSD